MNTKIILSIAVIGAVAAMAIGGTVAYFTDTEVSTGNTFTAGTIDIAVNGQNPWSQTGQYQFADMKPSQVEYSNFTINNTGSNPANVWKRVDVVSTTGGAMSEPECIEQGGTWNGQCIGGQEVSNIDTAITYDLSVKVKDEGNVVRWEQTLYNMDKTITEINGQGTYLGMIPAGWSMDVTESYHMIASTTNWAQGDVMNFNITVTAEQLKGTVVLEDKNQVAPWMVLSGNDINGTLTYGVKDAKFNFSFAGKAPLASTGYSLIVYKEAWSSPADSAWPRSVIVLASATSDGSGNVTIPQTSIDFGYDLLNSKVWLVKTADLTGNTLSTYTPSAYLFETGLMDYYDSSN